MNTEDMPRHSYRRIFSRMGWALTALLAAQAGARAGLLLLAGRFPALSGGGSLSWLSLILPVYLIGFPAALLVLRTLPAPSRRTARSMGKRQFFSAFIICLSLLYLSNFVTLLITGLIGYARGRELFNPVSSMADWPLWLSALVGCVLAPAAEEFLFRGALLRRLEPYGQGFAILTSSLLFALLHGNLFQLLYAFGAGVCLSWLVLNQGALWQSMLLHALINGISVLLLTLSQSAGRIWEVILSFSILAVIACGVYLLIRSLRSYTPKPPKNGTEAPALWGYFLVNPGMTVFCLMTLLSVLKATRA